MGDGAGSNRQLEANSLQRRGVIVENKKLRHQILERTKNSDQEASSSLDWCHKARLNIV